MTALGSHYHVDSTRGALYEVVSIDDGPDPYRYTLRLVGQPVFGQALGDEIRVEAEWFRRRGVAA